MSEAARIKRSGWALLAALLCACNWAAASPARAATTPADSGSQVKQTFSYTGGEQQLSIPDGVRGIDVVAVGGRGGSSTGPIAIGGGLAAEVSAPVEVEPFTLLWVVVGGNGFSGSGGFNGGGAAQGPFNQGAGGGGATDLRTLSIFAPQTIASRLLVAAGGGGAGRTSNQSEKAGGLGGNAATNGARAESGGPNNTVGSGGFGGAGAAANAGGGGGEGGFPYSGSGSSGADGTDGSLGQGGDGGASAASTPAGGGGGGGGGLYGGGGGGGGAMMSSGSTPVATGGGGGGGGSSLVPVGGSSVVAQPGTPPGLSVEYSIPGTELSGPDGVVRVDQVSFEISSEEPGARFQCRLDSDREESWEACEAVYETPLLAEGPHRFEARAINDRDNFDPTPAALDFSVDLKPPPDPPAPPNPPAPPALGQPTPVLTLPVETATLVFGKPVLNRAKGRALLPVRINGPGRVVLRGAKVKAVVRIVSGPSTLRLPVRPRGKALAALRERGKAAVRVTVRFESALGGPVAKTRALPLRLSSAGLRARG